MKTLMDKSFRYRDSEETRKPGYLARRMAHYRALVNKPAQPQEQGKVLNLKGAKR